MIAILTVSVDRAPGGRRLWARAEGRQKSIEVRFEIRLPQK